MGMMDDMKDKAMDKTGMNDMDQDARARFEQLQRSEREGTLDDAGREELNQLRTRFDRSDSM